MKVLSLKQPFAELILLGRKKIELRKWNTHFRGKFLIHSPKNPDTNALKQFGFVVKDRNFSQKISAFPNKSRSTWRNISVLDYKELPCGLIVGSAILKDVKKYKNEKEHRKDKELHLASSYWGNYGFILENAHRIKPIPAKGKLNFWNFNYSPSIIQNNKY